MTTSQGAGLISTLNADSVHERHVMVYYFVGRNNLRDREGKAVMQELLVNLL